MSKALDKLRRGAKSIDSDRSSQQSLIAEFDETPTNNPRRNFFDDSKGRSKKVLGQKIYRERMMDIIDEGVNYSQEYESLFRSPSVEQEPREERSF